MNETRELLLEAYESISNIRSECACNVKKTCAASELTVRQIEYLKIIDKYDDMTFSRLAELTNNSKPTISEMINKFINLNMVYREKSPDDGRISNIFLTDQGKMIARYERITIERVIDRILNNLTKEEIETLIKLFSKVK
ncbi:MAG: MarR family winged helix-turn-helix transcriptional regulator [Spirochaetaceae bacterium]